MAENITSFYELYNRANDAGKATDIRPDDLFVLQRGTGSNSNKCIKGSAIKASTGLVIVSSYSESNPVDIPEPLLHKLYGSDTIYFEDTTVAGNKKIIAKLNTNSVEAYHLKSNSVTTAKIAEGSVTESKIALNSIQEQAIKAGAVTNTKLGDASVSTDKLQNNAVTGAKLDSSVIDAKHNDVDVTTEDIVDQSTVKCDVVVHQFSSVGTGGLVDITIYADALATNDYMTDVKFELRKSGSTTVEREFDVGTPSTTTTVSRRMVVKNGTLTAANYELHLTCKANFEHDGQGIHGFNAYDVDIRGISIA